MHVPATLPVSEKFSCFGLFLRVSALVPIARPHSRQTASADGTTDECAEATVPGGATAKAAAKAATVCKPSLPSRPAVTCCSIAAGISFFRSPCRRPRSPFLLWRRSINHRLPHPAPLPCLSPTRYECPSGALTIVRIFLLVVFEVPGPAMADSGSFRRGDVTQPPGARATRRRLATARANDSVWSRWRRPRHHHICLLNDDGDDWRLLSVTRRPALTIAAPETDAVGGSAPCSDTKLLQR